MIIDENTIIAGIYRRKYTSVAANSIETDSYTPPSGAVLVIEKIGGSAAIDSEVKVEITWDGDTVFATHTVDNQSVHIEYTGDGSKAVVIRLVNDSSITETIGGYWSGYIVE